MIYTPPDYKDLYEGQQKFIAELQDVIQELTQGLRDKMAMAALPALLTYYMTEYHGYNGVQKEAYDLADGMIEEKTNRKVKK